METLLLKFLTINRAKNKVSHAIPGKNFLALLCSIKTRKFLHQSDHSTTNELEGRPRDGATSAGVGDHLTAEWQSQERSTTYVRRLLETSKSKIENKKEQPNSPWSKLQKCTGGNSRAWDGQTRSHEGCGGDGSKFSTDNCCDCKCILPEEAVLPLSGVHHQIQPQHGRKLIGASGPVPRLKGWFLGYLHTGIYLRPPGGEAHEEDILRPAANCRVWGTSGKTTSAWTD